MARKAVHTGKSGKESVRGDRSGAREALLGETTVSPFQIFACLAVLTAATLAAYASSFKGAFVFDDNGAIISAENIRHLSDWRSWLLHNPRPVVTLSLAINYAIGGLNTFSYHVWNYCVHVLSAWTLFGIVRRTIWLHEPLRKTQGRSANWIALVIALLWAVHPLQTEAVTYLIQRGESMMGLFGLLMLYCVIRGAQSKGPAKWNIGSVIACLLGMGSKAGIPSMPLAIFLYDILIISPSIRKAIVRRGSVYAVQIAAIVYVLWSTNQLPSLFSKNPGYPVTVGFGLREHTPLQYLSGQPGVILKYVQLALWPHSLCIDYEWKVPTTLAQIVLPSIPLLLLILWTCIMLFKRHWSALMGIWFIGLLGPSSSFMPVKDLAAEHRMYLPLAAVIAAAVAACNWLMSRIIKGIGVDAWNLRFGLTAIISIALIVMTAMRNNEYESPAKLWASTVEARPDNARAWTNYGEALASLNKIEWAVDACRRAIALDAKVPDVFYNLGNALQLLKQYEEAEQSYQKAIALKADYLAPYVMLGNLYQNTNRQEKAEESFRAVIAQGNTASDRVTVAKAYFNLGNSLAKRSKLREAIEQYRMAIATSPGYDRGHYGLAWALERFGQEREAFEEYAKTVELNPADGDSRASMENLSRKLGIPIPPRRRSP